MPAFDSTEYAWANVSIVLAGKKLGGVQGVKYKYSTEKERLFGAGGNARSIQTGNTTVEGELMLLQNEYDILVLAARAALGSPFAKVTELPGLDLVISYLQGVKSTTDIVFGVSFTEVEKGMESGDKFMKITMPFLAIDVQEGA